jgi:hypothetical protein
MISSCAATPTCRCFVVTTTTDDLIGTPAVLSKLARELDSGGRSQAVV